MTEKQELVKKLNELYAKLGYKQMDKKRADRHSIGVIRANIKFAEKELAAR